MDKIYITITGMNHYHGSDFLKEGMKVLLVKELDNEYDREAIRVELEGMGKIGYVANSVRTVLGESISAGRLYDKIRDTAEAKVRFITCRGTICSVKKKTLISQ